MICTGKRHYKLTDLYRKDTLVLLPLNPNETAVSSFCLCLLCLLLSSCPTLLRTRIILDLGMGAQDRYAPVRFCCVIMKMNTVETLTPLGAACPLPGGNFFKLLLPVQRIYRLQTAVLTRSNAFSSENIVLLTVSARLILPLLSVKGVIFH